MAEFNLEYMHRIICQLDAQGKLCFSDLCKYGGFKISLLKKYLTRMLELGFVSGGIKKCEVVQTKKGTLRKIPKVYYELTDENKRLFLQEVDRREQERLKQWRLEEETMKKAATSLENEYPEMSEEEWVEFYDDFKDQFEYWFKRVDRTEGSRLASFNSGEIPIYSDKCSGSITIRWCLTPQEMERRNRELDEAWRKSGKTRSIFKEGKPLEDGSYPAIEIGYATPDGKVVLFEKQPKKLVKHLKATEIIINKDAKPQEAPTSEPSAEFSKQMKDREEKLRKALYGYARSECYTP